MPRKRRRDEEEAGEEEIMITPLVDVVFLLLIFFLVTAALKKPTRIWDINLPAETYATSGRFTPDEIILTFMPDKGGESAFHVSDKAGGTRENVSMTELRKVLSAASSRTPRPQVRIDADTSVRMYRVAEIMDVLRNYQLRDVAFRAHDR